jgi:hypothetical protein
MDKRPKWNNDSFDIDEYAKDLMDDKSGARVVDDFRSQKNIVDDLRKQLAGVNLQPNKPLLAPNPRH